MKKLLSMILVLAMLCTMFVLASCGDKTDESSSTEATSSEESVAPPTKAELLETALESLDTYLDPIGSVFAIDSAIFDSTTGKANMTLSIDELSAMGENAFGEDPLKFVTYMEIGADAQKALTSLHAAGDEIKIETYLKDGKQYIIFPELYENSVFDYADFAGTEEEEGATAGAVDLEELKALLLKDENITISEDGKTYTVALDKEAVDKLMEIVGSLSGMTSGMDDIIDMGGTSEAPVEAPEPDSATIVFDLSSDTQATVTCKALEGETVVYSLDVKMIVLGETVSITVKGTEEDAEVLDITLTAVDSTVTVEGDMNMDGMLFDIDLTATKAESNCALEGTISLGVDMSGMMLTIPFEVEGTVGMDGSILEMGLSLSASLEGMMDIGLSVEMDYTPADVTVTLPFGESDIAEFDEDDFNAKMAEVYPNANELFGGSMGNDYGESYDYCNEDYTTMVRIYEGGYADIVVGNLTYEKTDDTFKFFKGDTTVYEFTYTLDENGAYVIYGETCDTLAGDPEYDEYLENFYYYGDKFQLDAYINPDGSATIMFSHALDMESEDFVMILPDGNTVTYDIVASEDGMTLTFLGETLTLEVLEY